MSKTLHSVWGGNVPTNHVESGISPGRRLRKTRRDFRGGTLCKTHERSYMKLVVIMAAMVCHSSSRVTRRTSVVTLVVPGSGTLQAAHDAAAAGDTLVLADGTYTGSANEVLQISKNITLRAQNPGLALIDGERTRRGLVISTGGEIVLEFLNITRGYKGSAGFHGGGIFVSANANVHLTSCSIHNCQAGAHYSASYGGGIYVSSYSNVHMTSCLMYRNWAGDWAPHDGGGGIYIGIYSDVTLTSCEIYDNTACGNGDCCVSHSRGGGLYVDSNAEVSLISCSIYGNEATGHSRRGGRGGGIYVSAGANAHLTSCFMYGNDVARQYDTDGPGVGYGGGLYVSGTVTLVHCQIDSNTALTSGSDLYISGGSVCTWETSLTDISGGTVGSCSAPSLPPTPSAPPPSDSSDDGSILELTGTAPKIHFGPEDAPVCSLTLDSLANTIVSSCTLVTPSHSGGGRNLDETEQTAPRVSQAEHEALKTEVAALRRMIHELLARKK